MSDCVCEKWKKNINKLDAWLVFAQIRTSQKYEVEKFGFCPWCGSALGAATTVQPSPQVDAQ